MATVAALAASLCAAACTSSGSHAAERQAANAFLAAVGRRDVAAAAAATTAPPAARTALARSLAGLGAGARARFTVTAVTDAGGATAVDYRAGWQLPGTSTRWSYTGAVPVRRANGRWRVLWRPADIYPALRPGEHLVLQRSQPARGALEDSAGHALFTPTPVVRVGVERKLVTDLPALAAALAAVPQLQTTAAEITSAVAAAPPTDFVPVITLRRAVYEGIRSRIHDLPGTVFATDTMLLPPSPHFAEPLLGSVGPATAAQVAQSHGRLRPGDLTGIGGLQQALDRTLSGTAGVAVAAVRDDGVGSPRRVATVVVPRPGGPVRLTLDRALQTAAESALAGVRLPAAIVAVQRSTGRVLADADSVAAGYDLGLAGAFPAGSTFKIVTYAAAFTARPALTPATRIPCPATTTVDGRVFENENRFHYPPVPVSAAFGYSCNTSAIDTALSLPSDALGRAATALGLGARWTLPVTAFAGSLPAPAGATERAADAIGQGRVQVSPLLMALIAGAAATGTPARPSLLADRPVITGTALPAPLVVQAHHADAGDGAAAGRHRARPRRRGRRDRQDRHGRVRNRQPAPLALVVRRGARRRGVRRVRLRRRVLRRRRGAAGPPLPHRLSRAGGRGRALLTG